MTSRELKNRYLNFFRSKGHAVIPSASLVPENDPSILFTTAGMHPLVPFLMGEKHPQGTRLVSIQKCFRTGDIDDVGDRTHLTFFEMLGNWSLGDYGKKEAIEWSFEFLTKELNISIEKLAVSVFAGDDTAPRDDEAAALWKSLGVPKERVVYLGKQDNWWPAGGMQPGPQGPDTEMFFWSDFSVAAPKVFDPTDKRWVEIWNDVFMEYEKLPNGSYAPLTQKNVDTGMGLERTAMVLDGKSSVYDLDTIEPIVFFVRGHATNARGQDTSVYIIVDHVRSAVFLLADERTVRPSNVDQGYILRRLIRRMIRHMKMIGFDMQHLPDLVQAVIHEYHYDYPELIRQRTVIIDEMVGEKDKFLKTLVAGLLEFEKLVKGKRGEVNINLAKQGHDEASMTFKEFIEDSEKKVIMASLVEPGKPLTKLSSKDIEAAHISGKEMFYLFQSYGFPPEITMELAAEYMLTIDEYDLKEFHDLLKKHQDKSRTATVGKFKGGLADHSEMTVKYHTANHMLLEAMKRVLGRDVVNQRGSNITSERLRFDFTFPTKLTPDHIKQIESIVNTEISKEHSVHFEEMSVDEAKKLGATGVFDHKYGDKVKVYFVGDYSKEICGGPHVTTTKGMGRLKIAKEEASSAGVRRIKAVLE